MRNLRCLAGLTLALVALAVPCAAAPTTPSLALQGAQVCSAALPQAVLTSTCLSVFSCGTCAGPCSGLAVCSPCVDEAGVAGTCIGLVLGNKPARCALPDTGNRCWCAASSPEN